MFIGFTVLLVAGLCQGSFGLGYKKFTPFSWAVFWGIYSVFCGTVATVFAFLSVPRITHILVNNFSYDIILSFLFGAVWGISAVCFSKAIDKTGMSLVYGISMGISTVVGSVTPMVLNNSFKENFQNAMFWVSLVLTLIGVALVTAAGIKRDGKKKKSLSGILLSVFAGIGSGFMNAGFACNDGLSAVLDAHGCSQLGVSAVKWMPVLIGGNIACVLWCICEATVKKEWQTLIAKGSVIRSVKLFGVSLIWYAALMLYGYSTHLLGDIGNTVGWLLFNSLALIVSVVWGLRTGEWKNQKKLLLFAGCAFLVLSWVCSLV